VITRCPQCGAPAVTGTAFCTKCGRPRGQAAAPSQHRAIVPTMSQRYGVIPPRSIRGSAIIGAVLGTMALLILIALMIHAISGPSSGDDSLPPIVAPLQNGTTFSNPALSMLYPSGWTVGNNDNNQVNINAPAALGWRSEGELLVDSSNGGGAGASTIDFDIATLLQSRQKSYPDATMCRNPADATEAGKAGKDFVICYTLTSQNGPNIRIRDEYFFSVTANRSAFYEVGWWSPEDAHSQFIQDAAPLVASITWKLP
jgi:hypothetical protein